MAIATELSAFVSRLSLDSLPLDAVARTRLLVLDLAGNAVRTRHGAEGTPALVPR